MADNKQNTNPNVPNLRFGEYSDEWNLTELQKVATISKGSGISKDQLSENGTYCILYGELYTKYNSEIISEVYSKTELDAANLVKSKENDVIIPCSGETAIDISTARCVPFNGILLGGDLNIIRLKNQNGGFFAYQLNGKRKVDIAKVAQGVSVVHLYGEHLKRVKIAYPTYSEQKKIADFLSLLDSRIATQNKIIQQLQSLIKGIRYIIYTQLDCVWIQLSNLIVKGLITLKRGNVIPKYEYSDEYCYPVYSSSTQNGGLMGYFNTYMFDKSLISWSIDGGGNFFYRDKHKFNVTNVCGYLEADESKFDYRFISELLIYQHSRMVFDYQTKAHPSVIEAMYYLPILDLEKQQCYSKLFEHIYDKLDRETSLLNKYEEQKKFLLSNMFI